MKFILSVLVSFVFFPSVFAQSSDAAPATTCFQPFSYKFAELTKPDRETLRKSIKEFEIKLSQEAEESRGFVIFYGGRNSSMGDHKQIGLDIRTILAITETYKQKYVIWDGGFRELPEVEIFIQPLACSEAPKAHADLQVDEVNPTEAPLETRIRMAPSELEKNLISAPRPLCPAAATAIGVCLFKEGRFVEVFIIVGEQGTVIFSRAVSGHPLLKSAAETAVLNWKFSIISINGKLHSADGRIMVEFEPRTGAIKY